MKFSKRWKSPLIFLWKFKFWTSCFEVSLALGDSFSNLTQLLLNSPFCSRFRSKFILQFIFTIWLKILEFFGDFLKIHGESLDFDIRKLFRDDSPIWKRQGLDEKVREARVRETTGCPTKKTGPVVWQCWSLAITRLAISHWIRWIGLSDENFIIKFINFHINHVRLWKDFHSFLLSNRHQLKNGQKMPKERFSKEDARRRMLREKWSKKMQNSTVSVGKRWERLQRLQRVLRMNPLIVRHLLRYPFH